MVFARLFILISIVVTVPAILARQRDKQVLANWYATFKHIDTTYGEKNADLSLQALLVLKDRYTREGLHYSDSVYAKLLFDIAFCKYYQNDYYGAVEYAKQSLRINTAGRPDCNPSLGARTYRIIGHYYEKAGNYTLALRYLDSAIVPLRQYFTDWPDKFYATCQNISDIYKEQGSYQEAFDWAENGLQKVNSTHYNNAADIAILNQRAAFAMAELALRTEAGKTKFDVAKNYLSKALNYYTQNSSGISLHLMEWNTCKMTQAIIARYEGDLPRAFLVLKDAIDSVNKYQDDQVKWMVLDNTAKYYADTAVKNYPKALLLYMQMNALLGKANVDSGSIANLYNDIGHITSILKKEEASLHWFQRAFRLQAGPYASKSLYELPTLAQLASRPSKWLSFTSLHNWAELLAHCYMRNGNTTYLRTSEKAFLLADALFTNMRHTQSGNHSKEYWRTKSRNFYQQALEMCWIKKDSALAFYYMEKSRAALLNDALNDLKAKEFLPDSLVQQRDSLKERVMEKEYNLTRYVYGTPAYEQAFWEKNVVDQALKSFITMLEEKNRYPQYNQNKYADKVVAVNQLQQYLQANHQQWVQYFLSDTLLFVLYANGTQMTFQRQVVKNFEQTLPWFLSKCADEKFQINQVSFDYLVHIAANIYDTLLRQPCPRLQKGRLIVSPDNIVIPFDALCTNRATEQWMVHDYITSYAYSARSLLNPPIPAGKIVKGNFFGMAPVHFSKYHLQTLVQSEKAVRSFKQYYPGAKLIIGEDATSKALLSELKCYTVANLLTHASGNSTNGAEPQIYTADTPVRLSQLQQIHDAATQVIILSACETNAGKSVTGEGVFSLARGFATAGVPTAVATLWNAHEIATYRINDSLNKYISQGMCIDSALHKAKLAWLQQNPDQSPYYWANLTLMGSAKPVQLQPVADSFIIWWGAVGGILLVLAVRIGWKLRRSNKTA